MIYHIIVNPIAGRKNSEGNLNELQKYILNNNIHCKIYFSRDFGHPKRLAHQIEKANPEGGVIVVCGGDGTISEVINGITDLSKWTFGIIPMGSGNDLASKLQLPKNNVRDAFDIILSNKVKVIDYMMVNNTRCLNIAGTGVDVDILERFETYTKMHGSLRYYRATLVSLAKYKGVNYKITLDGGEPFVENTFIVCICNGSQFGGGIKICQHAVVDDAYLDYVNCRMINKINIPAKMIKLLNGKINKCNPNFYQTKKVKCATVEKEDGSEFALETDGSIMKANKFTFQIVPAGLKLFSK